MFIWDLRTAAALSRLHRHSDRGTSALRLGMNLFCVCAFGCVVHAGRGGGVHIDVEVVVEQCAEAMALRMLSRYVSRHLPSLILRFDCVCLLCECECADGLDEHCDEEELDYHGVLDANTDDAIVGREVHLLSSLSHTLSHILGRTLIDGSTARGCPLPWHSVGAVIVE